MTGPDLGDRMIPVQRAAIDAAVGAGIEIVEVPGHEGTAARQFDVAAHDALMRGCRNMFRGEAIEVAVLTEETPYLAEAIGTVVDRTRRKPEVPLLVVLFDPIDGSMQFLNVGAGYCTAGLATLWVPNDGWVTWWAGVMLPGSLEAHWCRYGRSSGSSSRADYIAVDTVAINDFRCRPAGTAMIAALDSLEWMKYRYSSGGNPLAVSMVRSPRTVMAQPMSSKPHDAIGTFLLKKLDLAGVAIDVYDLSSDRDRPVSAAIVDSWFADPASYYDKGRVPPHVVGPSGAARQVWQTLRPYCDDSANGN